MNNYINAIDGFEINTTANTYTTTNTTTNTTLYLANNVGYLNDVEYELNDSLCEQYTPEMVLVSELLDIRIEELIEMFPEKFI